MKHISKTHVASNGNIIYHWNPILTFEEKRPFSNVHFSRMCVFVVEVFLGGTEQSVLLWSRFCDRRHSVCTGSSCPWPKTHRPTAEKDKVSHCLSFLLQLTGDLPHSKVVSPLVLVQQGLLYNETLRCVNQMKPPKNLLQDCFIKFSCVSNCTLASQASCRWVKVCPAFLSSVHSKYLIYHAFRCL